jgi:glutamine amidotransferase
MKIGIVNYSIGNVGSVLSALEFYNYSVSLVAEPDKLVNYDIIVLAGVGNFSTATTKLKEGKFWDRLNHLVLVKKKPVIGICLGMQIYADVGYEDGVNKGLGWIKGKVEKIKGKDLIVPHIGWRQIKYNDSSLFKDVRYHSFYFMHSYHFLPDDRKTVIATADYGGLQIVAAVKQDNIIGTQFHPEKSQGDGLRFLKNAVEYFIKN